MIWLALLLFWQADPDQVRFEQAKQLADSGHCRDAMPVFQQLLPAHPHISAIPFALGQCEFNSRNYLAAVDSLEKALRIDPHMSEARALYGSALGLSGRMADAIVQLREAVKSDNDFAPSFRLLGMFEVEDGQTGAEARAALERAAVLDPSDARAHYWLGQLHLVNKDFEAAASQYSASLALQPQSVQAMLGYARALSGAGQSEAALNEFQNVLKLDNGSADALLGEATCYYNLRKFPEALAAARQASGHITDLRERRAELWLLSRLYRATGERDKALVSERGLADMELGLNDTLARSRTLQEQALRYRAAGDYARLASTLEAALKLEQRQDSLVMLGDAYRALNRPQDAERCYVRALAAGPELELIAQRLKDVRESQK